MQAGRRERFRRAAIRSIGASGPRFPSLFDVGREHSRAATHVDACDGVLSDAGSTPAASTTDLLLDARLGCLATRSRRRSNTYMRALARLDIPSGTSVRFRTDDRFISILN